MQTTTEEIKRMMKEAGLPDGAGENVIFPYGARIVEIEGKPMLEAMTVEDLRGILSSSAEPSDRAITAFGNCRYDGGAFCISDGCTYPNFCSLQHENFMGFYCICKSN